MKLLKETYKTREGAEKRARFENGIAVFEHQHGYKARLYHYVAIKHEGNWRVQRQAADRGPVALHAALDAHFAAKP